MRVSKCQTDPAGHVSCQVLPLALSAFDHLLWQWHREAPWDKVRCQRGDEWTARSSETLKFNTVDFLVLSKSISRQQNTVITMIDAVTVCGCRSHSRWKWTQEHDKWKARVTPVVSVCWNISQIIWLVGIWPYTVVLLCKALFICLVFLYVLFIALSVCVQGSHTSAKGGKCICAHQQSEFNMCTYQQDLWHLN